MILCSISWHFFRRLHSWQKHVIFAIAFVCAFMTIRISDAPSWLSGRAINNSWRAVSGGKCFWQNGNRVCRFSSLGHSLSVQAGFAWSFTWQAATVLQVERWKYWARMSTVRAKGDTSSCEAIYIHALVIIGWHESDFFTSPVTGGYLFARGAHWQ